MEGEARRLDSPGGDQSGYAIESVSHVPARGRADRGGYCGIADWINAVTAANFCSNEGYATMRWKWG
ncbi:MAG: hypothetical protein JWO87_2330 [Phycisphaerales bacterium]|nr:hypothetical protein [Phycisphaerales bacterium]